MHWAKIAAEKEAGTTYGRRSRCRPPKEALGAMCVHISARITDRHRRYLINLSIQKARPEGDRWAAHVQLVDTREEGLGLERIPEFYGPRGGGRPPSHNG